MATRIHHALRVLAPALLLAGAVPLLATDSGITDSLVDEKRRLVEEAAAAPAAEIEAALAAERLPAALPRTRPVPIGVGGNPLAIGVDDAAIPMAFIDPTGVNPNVPVPVGVQVWGAAYDPVTDILYLSSGSTFHHWDVTAGTLTTIGNFTSSVDAAILSIEGLAVANGTLLASRVGNSATNPEGIYSIDPATGVATLVEAFATTTGQTLSGLDADPVTGTLYGTNDATTNRGLVEIPLDGSGTVILITDYPAGETDIDGLAVGTDGRAYLVEDDGTAANGQVHVWDFALAAYQAPIPTPWATSEVFSAGAWVAAGGPVARITLTKTVGTTPGVCAPTDEITVVTGAEVYYCYTVENTGTLTLNLHDLVDDQLGVLLEDEPITLAPGATHQIISSAVVITAPVVNNATWTARALELVGQCSGAPILLPGGAPGTTSGPAAPYPASVTFAGAPTAPGTVTVELRGISHTFPDDLDFLLEGPGGQTLVFMSDVGDGNAIVDIDLTIDDAAAAILPDSTQITAGSWQPSNVTTGDPFAAPAPAGPYGDAAPAGTDTLTSVFGGLDPNGSWDLWIVDDAGGDVGELDEWCLNLRTDLGQATASDSATVNILDPQIAVTPASLTSTLEPGTTEDQPLTIQNTGGAPLDWAIDEAPAGLARIPTAVLHDNGPLVTHPGGGSGGADASALQTALAMNTLGFGHQIVNNNRMADDFMVPGPTPWNIDTITFFAYQTGSTTTSTITDVRVQIWDGPPNAGGTVIFGDLTTNRLVSSTWSNGYRVTDTTLTDTTRPIMANLVSIGTTLPPGTYWLDWFCGGTLASGPWAPPVTILGQTTTGNALQFTASSGTWNPALDTGTSTQQDMPFVIEGTSSLCSTPSDLPWISVNPTSGSTAPGASDVVTVTFDAGALAPGVYDGLVCVNSNDPVTPLVEVPVSLTVSDTMPFIADFEEGDFSEWSSVLP